jgi:hypothetical protein
MAARGPEWLPELAGIRSLRQLGQALAAPAGEVGHDGVDRASLRRIGEVQLGLGEDPPAARTAAAAVEGSEQLPLHGALGARVLRGRARHDVQHAADQLGDEAVGHGLQVGVGRPGGRLSRGRVHRFAPFF